MSEPVRLSKRVAAMLPCSRREAELYIEGGWVRVDGQVIDEPQYRVSDAQRVEVDHAATLAAAEPVTLLLHKPADAGTDEAAALLVPTAHAADDPSGIRILKRHLSHLEPLLALPRGASGLSVFSQERRIVRKLNEDAASIEQELIVQVEGQIATGGLALLGHGLAAGGKPLPPIKVSWQNEARLRFALKGIAPGQLPWMCQQVGLRAVAIKRIRIGRVPMARLEPGLWRYLGPDERF